MNPLVSVIVPIYKVEKYLAKCLDSIARQTYTNIQVILVNDGSPDNCQAICETYCQKDNRFELINKANGGPSSARNIGFNFVRGDFVIYIDADDWIEPNMIEILVHNIVDNKADMSICTFYKSRYERIESKSFTNNLQKLSQEEAIKRLILPSEFYGFLWNKLLKKEIVKNLRFDESIIKGEDSLFLCKYILNCKFIVYQDIPLYHYRVDSISITRSSFNEKKNECVKSLWWHCRRTCKRKLFKRNSRYAKN